MSAETKSWLAMLAVASGIEIGAIVAFIGLLKLAEVIIR